MDPTMAFTETDDNDFLSVTAGRRPRPYCRAPLIALSLFLVTEDHKLKDEKQHESLILKNNMNPEKSVLKNKPMQCNLQTDMETRRL